MRRALKYLGFALVVLVGLVGALLLGANTGPGQRAIETLIARATGGEVGVEGLTGRFPDAIQAGRITVADDKGIWLTINHPALDWSPRRMLWGELSIDRLEAESVAMTRLPVSSGSSGGVQLPPAHTTLADFRVARVEIATPVAGQALLLSADGSAAFTASDTGEVHLAITSLAPHEGSPNLDRYTLALSMDVSRLQGTLQVAEGAKGLIAGLAGLPDLGGSITANVSADGLIGALATRATIQAGPLQADLNGTVDMASHATNLGFSVVAPAMEPRPGVGWSSIRLEGTVHGPFANPDATGLLTAKDVTAEGAGIGTLRMNVSGSPDGQTQLHALLDGLRVPGPSPDLLADSPLTLDATTRLGVANLPVRFSLSHTLFSVDGNASTVGAQMTVVVPELAPFAAVGAVDAKGHASFDIGAKRAGDAIDLTVKGGVAIADGLHPLVTLVGDAGTIDLAATIHDQDVTLTRLALNGHALNASAKGQFVDRKLDADWTLALTDLGALRPDAAGTITARGHAAGPAGALSITGDVTGNIAAQGARVEQFTAHLTADGLPTKPSGQLSAGGTVLGAPLALEARAERRDEGLHFVIDRAAWKSLTAGGTLDLPPNDPLPTGKVTLTMTRLADLTPVLGRPIAGNLTASIESSPTIMRIGAVVAGGQMAAAGSIGKAVLDATVTDPTGQPAIDGTLTLDGIQSNGVRGTSRLTAKGKLDGPDLTFAATSGDLHGAPSHLETAGTFNKTAWTLSLASLRGTWGKETVRLLAPARIAVDHGALVDRLRLGFRQGELAVVGGWKTGLDGHPGGLDVRANVIGLPADMIGSVAPAYAMDGTISGDAALTGDATRPRGTIHVSASGLRMRTGNGRAIPPATSTLAATLDGAKAHVDARLSTGTSSMTATGSVPLDFAGSMDLRLGGALDLAMVSPILEAQGRRVRGRVDVAMGVGGTMARPRMSGTVRLANGEYQDSSLGAHITAISGTAQADGDAIRIDRFNGQAGQGTISVAGTLSIAAAPAVDLTLRASNARVLSTDLITTLIDADLTLRGVLTATPTLAGTVLARTAEIQVPEKLPPSVVVLDVREAGARLVKPPPPAPAPDIALHLTLDAPDQIYIRGRGLDVELGGRVAFTGTASQPLADGALKLRRGTFSLAGQSMNLTEGTIDFGAGSLTNPPLKLVATSSSASLVATLTISGEVRDPKIVLSSVPDLPQDEILSQLLFNTAQSKLNPFQVAQIAAALASISGVGPSIGDPLGRVRAKLGLDQLSVGTDANGGSSLQAGRYIARGVRIGAAQSATGGGTQATVQIDIAKGLKLETTVGSGSAEASGATSGGTSVGLTYEFEY
jgi:translocation and assembly module TamB